MKSSQVTLIIIGFILLALMATNPSIEDHREGVKKMYKEKLGEMNKDKKDDLATQIGTGIGMLIGDGFIDKIVSRDNYLLFSLTKVSVGDKIKNIGIGILGQVFIQDYEKIQSEIGSDGLVNESETIESYKKNDILERNQEKESVSFLQDFTHEEVEKTYQLAFATEGHDYGLDRESFKLEKYIVSSYGLASYARIKDKIEIFEEKSFKRLSNGYVHKFSNTNYTLVINATKVESLADALMDGMVKIEGNIELFDNKGVLLQNFPHFYCEGF